MSEYSGLIPDLILSVGATVVLLAGAVRDDKSIREFLKWLSLVVLGGATLATLTVYPQNAVFANGWLQSTVLSRLFTLVFLAIVAWVVLAGNMPEQGGAEWYALLLFAALGMVTLARTANLAALFLGLEILSLALYVLIGFAYRAQPSLRAAAMYLVLAGFASGLLAFGAALVYVAYGTLSIPDLALYVASTTTMPLCALIGFGLILSGAAFKLAVVPFNMWVPDVYEAAPGAVSGLIASGVKGAMLAAIVPFAFLRATHGEVLWAFAAASMLIGNLLALREARVKRILAYSSIGHVGYMLIGLIAGPVSTASGTAASALPRISGITAILFYIVAYALAILGAFVSLGMLHHDSPVTLSNLHGVAKRKPVLAACLLVFVISLAGLPPTAGFFGKLFLFSAGVQSGYLWLAAVGLLGSAIGVYYYIRILISLFLSPVGTSQIKIIEAPLQSAVLIATAIVSLLIGVFPETLLRLFAR